MSSKTFFFNNLLIVFCKSIFYVSAVNCYCTYVFKGSTTDFMVLFSKNISEMAILTQVLSQIILDQQLLVNIIFTVFLVLVLHV